MYLLRAQWAHDDLRRLRQLCPQTRRWHRRDGDSFSQRVFELLGTPCATTPPTAIQLAPLETSGVV